MGDSLNIQGVICGNDATYQDALVMGMNIRSVPNPATGSIIGMLIYGTRVNIVCRNHSNGWVFVTASDGTSGWIAEHFVMTAPPDSGATLVNVHDLNLTSILKSHYVDTGLWELETGSDYTTLAAAVLAANRDGGVRIDFEKKEEYEEKNPLRATLDPMSDNFATYAAIEVRKGANIWLPSTDFIKRMQKSGVVASRPGWMNEAMDIGDCLIGFNVGFYSGLYGSIWDTFRGLFDTGAMVVEQIEKLFTGELLEELGGIYDDLTESFEKFARMNEEARRKEAERIWELLMTTVSGTVDDFMRMWNHPDAYKRWEYRGRLVGQISLEVALALATAGAGNAVKWVGVVGKFSPKLAAFLSKAIGKVDNLTPDLWNRKRKGDGQDVEADTDSQDLGAGAVERQTALSIAKAITAEKDADGSSLPELMFTLEGVERKFKCVHGHVAESLGEGNYKIKQQQKRRELVWPRFSDDKERESEGSERVHAAPGDKKEGWNPLLNGSLRGTSRYFVNGYEYITDELGRVIKAKGRLKLKKRDRNKYQQSNAPKIKDGNVGDDGGHIFASIFDGPGEQINYWAQAQSTNRSGWKRMENFCKKQMKEGKNVEVEFEAFFEGDSKRPNSFSALISVDGDLEEFLIPNY